MVQKILNRQFTTVENKNEKKVTHQLTTTENKNNNQVKNAEKNTPKEENDKNNKNQTPQEKMSTPEPQNIKKEEEKPKNQNIQETPQQNINLKPEEIKVKTNDSEENFLEGITYERYLSKLKQENKKEHETGRESFCEGFFIASFPQKDGKVIENSQSFPSPCGHAECSLLPAMKAEIIARYPLKDTKNLELNNLAATICFPIGIKVCYSEQNPSMIKDYVTPITNQKGERYYMMTYHFYHKFMNDFYSKFYEMHPLKHHLMKFGDSYLNMSEEQMDESVMNQIQYYCLYFLFIY